jgi:protein-tyrosine phosphatase
LFAGVPESATHLLRFIHRVHATNAQTAQEARGSEAADSPILLHCSAGVGRTGTFIAISSLLPVLALQARGELPAPTCSKARSEPAHPLGPYPADELLQSSEPNSAGAATRADRARDFVGATIDGLRDQRTTMAQTSEQVAWVFDCLREAWRSGSYDNGPGWSA